MDLVIGDHVLNCGPGPKVAGVITELIPAEKYPNIEHCKKNGWTVKTRVAYVELDVPKRRCTFSEWIAQYYFKEGFHEADNLAVYLSQAKQEIMAYADGDLKILGSSKDAS